jgi:hypothetical protein
MGGANRRKQQRTDEPPDEPPTEEDLSKIKTGKGISMGNIGMGKKNKSRG